MSSVARHDQGPQRGHRYRLRQDSLGLHLRQYRLVLRRCLVYSHHQSWCPGNLGFHPGRHPDQTGCRR